MAAVATWSRVRSFGHQPPKHLLAMKTVDMCCSIITAAGSRKNYWLSKNQELGNSGLHGYYILITLLGSSLSTSFVGPGKPTF